MYEDHIEHNFWYYSAISTPGALEFWNCYDLFFFLMFWLKEREREPVKIIIAGNINILATYYGKIKNKLQQHKHFG